MENSKTTSNLLNQLSLIDRQLCDLVVKRVVCQHQIRNSISIPTAFEPQNILSDSALLQLINEHQEEVVSRKDLSAIFNEILIAGRNYEQSQSIAVLGPTGTYSESAAHKYFGQNAAIKCFATIEDVFIQVESGKVGYGVVPVENSTEGTVNTTLDSFQKYPVKIAAEIDLPIHHCLMNSSGSLEQIKKVYAHAQSLAQCRNWLLNRLPNTELVAVSSNAEGVKIASKDDSVAAIASDSTAIMYGLQILEYQIQDLKNNTTRFFVISLMPSAQSKNSKTSLMLSVHNKSGALYELLKPLADNNVSMTKIESRPAQSGLWEYMFFVDIEGHQHDANVSRALKELEYNSAIFKILGSYEPSI